MSTVKWRGNFTYRTVTPDSLKFSSPKARDDPSGSSSPPITYVCPGQSNFRGSTPDSLVITSPKPRVEPHGSVSALGCSDVQDRSIFWPISWFSLGCSTDHNTAASIVIAHKVGFYTSKASLYAWNSFIPEDFSSVLVHLIADLVMNSYSPFFGLIELIVPPEVILLYGSLPRPPESCFISYSWLRFTDAVCDWFMHSISKNLCGQGERLKVAVDPCCLDLCGSEADCYGFLLLESLACEVDLLAWMNLRELQVIASLVHGSLIIFYAIKDAALVQQLSSWFRLISIEKQQAYAKIGLWLKYTKMIVGFKTLSAHYVTLLFSVAESLTLLCDPHIWSDVQCEDVSFFLDKRHGVQELFRPCSSDDCTAAAVGTLMNGVNTVYKFLLGGYVLNRIAEKIIMQVSIQSDRTEISGLELMLKQSLSQAFLHLFNEDYGFLGCIYVTISAHFGFLTEIPYGSLPRPPDELLVISFSLLYFTLCSSCPRCNGLHLEGEY